MLTYLFMAFSALLISFLESTPFILEDGVTSHYMDDELKALWESIPDICNPSIDDYIKIQNYLSEGRRPYFDIILDNLYSMKVVNPDNFEDYKSKHINKRLNRHFRLIKTNLEPPIFQIKILGHCTQEDKSKCIILYGSYNAALNPNPWEGNVKYDEELLKLVHELENSGFNGHVLYRLGGFPLTSKGGLKLVHVPYSFKILSFIEASQLGYQDVLWIDSSMHPTNDLSAVFSKIHDEGVLLLHNGINLDYDYHFYIPLLPNKAINAAGLSPNNLHEIPHVIAGIIGISFSQAKSHQLVAEWYKLTSLTYPAMTLYPEEFLLSVASWRTFNRPTGQAYEYFDVRSVIPTKPSQSVKPFWFDKG